MKVFNWRRCWRHIAGRSKDRSLGKRPRYTAEWLTWKFLMCCLRVKQFPQCSWLQQGLYIFLTDPIFLSELWSIDSTWQPPQQFPACTPLREGGWGLVVTALPVNKNKVKDDKNNNNNNNNNKLALLIRNSKFVNPLHVNRRIQPESRKPKCQLFKAWLAKRVQLRLFGRPFLWVLFCPASF